MHAELRRAAQATRLIHATLRDHPEATAERAAQEKRYLKSDLTFIGLAMPVIRREAKAFVREQDTRELLPLAQALWASEVHELRTFAVAVLELKQRELGQRDLLALLELIRSAKTWALVDYLATKVMGPIVARDPGAAKLLDRWIRDEDFWVRRTALLCLHDPLLAGTGDFEHFARLATPLLHEREFFIRKAIGWILRSTAKRTPQRTFDYVAKHAAALSALTFKEATRNLPPKQQAELQKLRALSPAARSPLRSSKKTPR